MNSKEKKKKFNLKKIKYLINYVNKKPKGKQKKTIGKMSEMNFIQNKAIKSEKWQNKLKKKKKKDKKRK